MKHAQNRDRHFRFDDIDWAAWIPQDVATLCFVRRDGELLLIEKKRGLGAGKINGPGGRLEPGETPAQAAVREVEEELCITPSGLEECGELMFQFCDGYSIHGHVFTAAGFSGTPTETEEAVPLWTPVEQIPFHRMWTDDELWFPHMLGGDFFIGRFLFDGDDMLGHRIEVQPGGHRPA